MITVWRVAIVVACFVSMTFGREVYAKGRIFNCTWQVPETRVEQRGMHAVAEAEKLDPRLQCAKAVKKAESKRTEYIACLTKHTKRFHAGGMSSVEAAQEASKFCDPRITPAERTEPECAAEFKRADDERQQAENWCQTDAKCRDMQQRANEWLACARAVARVDEKKCYALRVRDLDQEHVDLRISEECQPRTEHLNALTVYRKLQQAEQAVKAQARPAPSQGQRRAEK